MKIARFERMARTQREYHRSHPWQLSKGGLFIAHSYADTSPDDLSWWDEVGLILNGRRVMVKSLNRKAALARIEQIKSTTASSSN